MTVHDICLGDIALSLSRQWSFLGYTGSLWSVASHSVSVYLNCLDLSLDGQRYALLHDAHEAYTGDIVREVKDYLDLDKRISGLQTKLDGLIFQALGCVEPCAEEKVIVKFRDHNIRNEEYNRIYNKNNFVAVEVKGDYDFNYFEENYGNNDGYLDFFENCRELKIS